MSVAKVYADNHRVEILWEVTNVHVHPDSNSREVVAKIQTNVLVPHVRMVALITVVVLLVNVLQDSILSQEGIALPLMVSIV